MQTHASRRAGTSSGRFEGLTSTFLLVAALTPVSATAESPSEPQLLQAPPHADFSTELLGAEPLLPRSWNDEEEDPTIEDGDIVAYDPITGIESTIPASIPPVDLPDDEGFAGETFYPDFELPQGAGAKLVPSPLVSEPNTAIFPWRTVAKLRVRFVTSWQSCTGAMLGARHILTAAECLYRDGLGDGWVDEVRVYPAETDVLSPTGEPEIPYGEARGIWFRVPSQWRNPTLPVGSHLAQNWGVVTLDRPVGNRVGWMARSSDVGQSVHYAGYGQSPIIGHGYDDQNVIDEIIANRFAFDGLVVSGIVGGPVWRVQTGPVDYLLGNMAGSIFGLFSGPYKQGAALLTNQRRQDINDWIALDAQSLPPTYRPDVHAYNVRNVLTPIVAPGYDIQVDFSVVNTGYADSGAIQVHYRLHNRTEPDPQEENHSLGLRTFSNLPPMQFHQRTETLTVPTSVPAGDYFLTWSISTAVTEYPSDNNTGELESWNDNVMVTSCWDRDLDGYGRFADPLCPVPNQVDCNDNEPNVHPGAAEIPGNGIDDNCNGTQVCGAVPRLAGGSELARGLAGAAPLALVGIGSAALRRRLRRAS